MSGAGRGAAQDALEFLCVDDFLGTLADARALKTALELGLIDYLVEHRGASADALGRAIGADRTGLRLLLDLLAANGVVEERAGKVRLHRRFAEGPIDWGSMLSASGSER